jgi:hypothetical protein
MGLLWLKPLPARRLTLGLRCGDLQRGYSTKTSITRAVALDSVSPFVLHQAIQVRKDAFLFDEMDRAGNRFEHRLNLSSHNELCVSFAAVAVGAHPVASRAAV